MKFIELLALIRLALLVACGIFELAGKLELALIFAWGYIVIAEWKGLTNSLKDNS